MVPVHQQFPPGYGLSPGHQFGGVAGSYSTGGAGELESAVGAFIRLLQDAPPLATAAGSGPTLAVGLAQLEEAGRQVQRLMGG
jgi:hypothetical protein